MKVVATITWIELEAAAREWRCSFSEALERLWEGETCDAAIDALIAHSFPENVSKWVH
jgi:hypothetical protein